MRIFHMKNTIDLEMVKTELEKMEDELIKGRKDRENEYGSTLAYRLYEIQVEKNREEDDEMTEAERIISYKERLDEIVNQHQINIEHTLNKMVLTEKRAL